MLGNKKIFKGTCHCGNVGFELINHTPEFMLECNCSICRRLGSLWVHAEKHLINLNYSDGDTITYIHGDKSLAFHSCKKCGCSTHWESLENNNTRVGLNFRMCDPQIIADFPIRRFDGADSWAFLN